MLFMSPQKLISFSSYFGFYLDSFVMQQNSLIRKIRLFSNFMTSQPGIQAIVIRILRNFWRSKGNQTLNFGQLIGCNLRNIFLEKPHTKYREETSPRPFPEKLKLSISLDQWSKVLYSLFSLYAKLRAIEIY